MRISDWSSDVCSSDLPLPKYYYQDILQAFSNSPNRVQVAAAIKADPISLTFCLSSDSTTLENEIKAGKFINRSEEHTSELQSLMRISYAVFCLKKKKINNNMKRNTCNNKA